MQEQEAGAKVSDVCRRHGVCEATFYNWKSKYGEMTVSEAKRLRALEAENLRLKKLVAELMLDKDILQDTLSKSGKPSLAACGGGSGALSFARSTLRYH